MLMRLPAPPVDSCIFADEDEQGQPRLSWNPPISRAGHVIGWAVFFGLGVALYYVLDSLIDQVGVVLAANGLNMVNLLLPLCWQVAAVWMLGIILYALGDYLLRGSRPDQVTFGADAIAFEPPLASMHDMASCMPAAQVSQVARDEFGAVQVVSVVGRQRLTIDRGAERLEVGARLTDLEREWLAGVLRAWVGAKDSADAWKPPSGSWITVEGDAEERHVSWQPPPQRGKWERWNAIGGAATGLVIFSIFGTVIKLVWLGLLMRVIFVGADLCLIVFLALLTAWLVALMLGMRPAVNQMTKLLQTSRPESVTLDDATLTHDPGQFLWLQTVQTGPLREIPLAEIRGIRLEREGGFVQQLTVVRDEADEVVIGQCLREPEREWLAELLRQWVGKEDGIPAEEADESFSGYPLKYGGMSIQKKRKQIRPLEE